jgi:hypothetical protein
MKAQSSTLNTQNSDAEAEAQQNELHAASRLSRGVIFLLFCLFAGWCRFQGWKNLQRRCAWCNRRLEGNPLAKRVTHGICKCCAVTFESQIEEEIPEQKGTKEAKPEVAQSI